MYIHVGAESAQIYTGMGARACMVKKSEPLDARKTWHHAVCILYMLYMQYMLHMLYMLYMVYM